MLGQRFCSQTASSKILFVSFYFLFYLALSPKGKGRFNRIPQLRQARYCPVRVVADTTTALLNIQVAETEILS